MNALLISSHPRKHNSCYNHAAHVHQLDLQRVRGSPTSDKSNPNRLSVSYDNCIACFHTL